jgi:hypothetical protein
MLLSRPGFSHGKLLLIDCVAKGLYALNYTFSPILLPLTAAAFFPRCQMLMIPPLVLGERLWLCRQEITWPGELPDDALTRVALEAQLPEEVVLRLEQTGEGTTTELAILLTYYVERDLNMRWVLLPNNADLPTSLLDDRWPWPDFTKAFSLVKQLSQHVQQVALEVQMNLTPMLPLDRYTPDELAAYQRDLPPVRAAKAGWQSQVQNLRPLHYYAAGEYIPACGNIAELLLYDSLPLPRVVSQAKCKTCLRRLAYAARPTSPSAS